MQDQGRRAVITGIGMVTPGGTLSTTWDAVRAGISTSQLFQPPDMHLDRPHRVGLVEDGDLFESFSPRLLKRMDRFCCLAIAAAQQALQDSKLDLEALDHQASGVYVGNMYGGWSVTDPSLRNLLRQGYRTVSPYVASAWFPTAPQGQITIRWNLHGYSKTVIADTASSALATGYAARAIQEGRAEVMLAGGAESPITPYTYSFCVRSGRLNPDGYRIFDPQGCGFQVGEGAVMLVLEELEAARGRGAHIYAELAGWSTGFQPCRSPGVQDGGNGSPWHTSGGMARVIHQALVQAGVAPQQLDYIGLDAQGVQEADDAEAEALALALGPEHERIPATTCKPTLTHLLGAGASAEIAIALLAMQQGEIPPIAGGEIRDQTCPLQLVMDGVRQADIRTALVNARGADGVQAALVFRSVA